MEKCVSDFRCSATHDRGRLYIVYGVVRTPLSDFFYDRTPTSALLASPRLTISRIDNPSFANA